MNRLTWSTVAGPHSLRVCEGCLERLKERIRSARRAELEHRKEDGHCEVCSITDEEELRRQVLGRCPDCGAAYHRDISPILHLEGCPRLKERTE